jgi:integrase
MIYRRGRIWWVKIPLGGGRPPHRESSHSPSEKKARALERVRLGEFAQGRLAAPTAARVTVDELLADLAADYRVHGRASRRTMEAHARTLLTSLAGFRAAQVTTARLVRLVEAWQQAGHAPATINKRLTTLRRAFNRGRQATPPKVSFVPRMPVLAELNAREGFFEKREFFAVLDGLSDEPLRDFVAFAYWTGMRKGEIAKLTWAGFSEQTWTLVLPAKSAKTKLSRKLVLAGPLREIIERRWHARKERARATGRLESLIFWRVYDGHPREGLQPGDAAPITEFRKAWATACSRAGVAGRLFHDLRRTGLRNLVRAGVTETVAMQISGHRTTSTFRRYNITTDDDLRDAVEKVAAYVEGTPDMATVVPLAARADGAR